MDELYTLLAEIATDEALKMTEQAKKQHFAGFFAMMESEKRNGGDIDAGNQNHRTDEAV